MIKENLSPKNKEWNGYLITTDPRKMQVNAIHQWLATKSHWAINIPFDTVKGMVENSFCIGVFTKDNLQIGFARLITDYVVFAYLADVYIEKEHRGKGLSKMMMDMMMEEEWVQNLRRLFLATKDAHKLYEKYGFSKLRYPERMMEVFKEDAYAKVANQKQ